MLGEGSVRLPRVVRPQVNKWPSFPTPARATEKNMLASKPTVMHRLHQVLRLGRAKNKKDRSISKNAEISQGLHEPAISAKIPTQESPLKLEEQPEGAQNLRSDCEESLTELRSDSIVTLVPENDLWEEAYCRLRRENPKIIRAFERDLLASQDAAFLNDASATPNSTGAGRSLSIDDTQDAYQQLELQKLVKHKLQSLQDAQQEIAQAGREVNVKDQIRRVMCTLLSAGNSIASIVNASPHAAVAWAGIFVILSLLVNPIIQFDEAVSGLQYITEVLVRCKTIEDTYILPPEDTDRSAALARIHGQLKNKLVQLYSQTLKYQIQLARQYSRPMFFRLLRDCVVVDDWQVLRANLENIEATVSQNLSIIDSSTLTRVHTRLSVVESTMGEFSSLLKDTRSYVESIERVQLIGKLPSAKYGAFNAYKQNDPRPECLQGTRVEILAQIQEWGECQNTEYIFWLSGMAGSGKSSIARSVARCFKEKGLLGASFFFVRGHEDLHTAAKLFTTIAVQLAGEIPSLALHVSEAIAKYGNIGEQALCDQWRHLILEPLTKLNESLLPLSGLVPSLSPIVVIDALDECEDNSDIEEILKLLLEAKDLTMVRLRIFVTSRPEMPIRLGFSNMPKIVHHDEILHTVPQHLVERDISIILRYRLARIRQDHCLDENWPKDAAIQSLVLKADRLFIYAATACRFLDEDQFPQKRLEEMLQVCSTPCSAVRGLDQMYILILSELFVEGHDEANAEMARLFRKVVGSVILLFDTLSIAALAKLFDISTAETKQTFKHLHSVLSIPDSETSPIQLFHLSFHDFLLDRERCRDPRLWISERSAHKDLFACCLDLLSNNLKRDICNLKQPGTLASEVDKDTVALHLDVAVQYACRYWVAHFQAANLGLHDQDRVHSFLQRHFLPWSEALSLMGKTSECVLALTSLQSAVKHTEAPDLFAFIQDAKKFILQNRQIIEEAPLQIYCTALIFTPETSIIRRCYQDQIPPWFEKLPNVEEKWSSMEQALEGHRSSVSCVEFSPDGSKLASGSYDRTIRIWNVATGQVDRILEGHSGYVSCIAFSPADAGTLASGSGDQSICIWSIPDGQIKHVLRGHSCAVNRVSFLPDCSRLLSGSIDSAIILWNVTTGQMEQKFDDNLDWIRCIAFSPSGNTLATSSIHEEVRMQNMKGQTELRLQGHSDRIRSLAFSPDGKTLASGSLDRTIRLWDADSDNCSIGVGRQLEGHTSTVNCVAFSPDSTKMASGSHDQTIMIWNITTGQIQRTLQGHQDSINCVAFSPDRTRLASGSDGLIVRIWNASTTEKSDQTSTSHSGPVNCLALSPNERRIASGAADHSIRIWNLSTGQTEQILNGHTDAIMCVAFSNNNKLVSGSGDRTIRIWDLAQGKSECVLEGHQDWIRSVAFSPESKRVASGSDDQTIRFWDISTGEVERTLKGHQFYITYMVFSDDGTKLASGAGDGTVRVWNTTTGTVEHAFQDHPGSICGIAFSPGGRLIVGTDERAVRVWNLDTGLEEAAFGGHSYWVGKLALSDGKRETRSFYGVDGPWVTLDGRRILYLPLDYRPGKVSTDGTTVIVGAKSGLVTIITFRSDVNVGSF